MTARYAIMGVVAVAVVALGVGAADAASARRALPYYTDA